MKLNKIFSQTLHNMRHVLSHFSRLPLLVTLRARLLYLWHSPGKNTTSRFFIPEPLWKPK